ncbi:hypothetical protein FRC10_005070 [Ceratobasidium sp. 414]|nr:hypothetical protein FRC10_005070 [Ceratobasidium sp. 414]
MLKSLLTPLRTRFEEAVSLRSEPQEPVPESPEDFERDARIETMRMVVQSINAVEDDTARIDLLGEAARLMQVDANTKDVFREMDGFLVVTSFMSTSAFSPSENPAAALEKALQVFSFATIDHPVNMSHFKHNVGYEAFESSLFDYVNRAEPGTASSTLSSLAAFAFQLPSLSSFLPSVDAASPHRQDNGASTDATAAYTYDPALIDPLVSGQDTTSARITHPNAVPILLRLAWSLSLPTRSHICYALAKLLDRLAAASHANRAALSQAGIVHLVWDRVFPGSSKLASPDPLSLPESTVLQKLLRRILDLGAPLDDLKLLFKRAADPAVAVKALGLLKGNPNARWPSFLAFRGDEAGLDVKQVAGGRGVFGNNGMTMLMWIYIEHRSSSPTHLFGFTSSDARSGEYNVFALVLRPDGGLAVMPTFRKRSMIPRGKWSHLGVVWGPGEAGLKMYVDGHLTDSVASLPYPRSSQVNLYYGCSPIPPPTFSPPIFSRHNPISHLQHQRSQSSYLQDSSHPPPPPQIYLSSTHLLTRALSAPLVRLAHHLGPRYAGTLRSGLGRYLSHEAATALNVYLFAAGNAASAELASELVGGIENGMGDAVLCALSPAGWVVGTPTSSSTTPEENDITMGERRVLNGVAGKEQEGGAWASVRGDVRMFEVGCVDEALRRVGGAAVGLGLVQRAETTEMLYESVCVLINGVRTNWRLLEDMESLSGYEVLGHLLTEKAGMVSLDVFNALFEHIGLDFKTPSKSVVTNIQAYRALGLDLDLWSRTSTVVQQAYLAHFSTLLSTSKFARFTIKSRFQSHKVPVVKKLLLAIQLGTFKDEMELRVVGALRVVAQAMWIPEVIKSVVAYLAANLQVGENEGIGGNATPTSTVSGATVDKSASAERAELVLESLVTILQSSSTHLTRFTAALPAPRVLLLLLGEHPTSVVASNIFVLLGILLQTSPSFSRKFELAHGWLVIKCVVPPAWDPSVHVAAFDILLGKIGSGSAANGNVQVANPVIFPTILAALQRGLQGVSSRERDYRTPIAVDSVMEVLVGELLELYGAVPTFKLLFKHRATMAVFVELCRSFLGNLAKARSENEREGPGGAVVRIEDKLKVLAGLLCENTVVDAAQKQEASLLRDISSGVFGPQINANKRQSVRMSLNTIGGGEPTYVKTMIRLATWRKSTSASERQRLRKMIQDKHVLFSLIDVLATNGREARRQVMNLQEWKHRIEGDPTLFPGSKREIRWQLDDTEGPFRVRKKMQMEHGRLGREPDDELPYFSREVRETDDDDSSVVHIEAPPWAESYEIASTTVEELDNFESDDKLRHIRHELAPGDVVEEVQNITRVLGVDAWPGLIIMGKTHLYLVDGLYQNQQGEIVAAVEAPKDAFLIPGVALELDNSRLTQKWQYNQLAAQSKRTFLFRDVGVEFYFKDNRTALIVCATPDARQQILNKIAFVQARSSLESVSPGGFRSPLINRVSARVAVALQGRDEVATAMRRWQAREISNFAYLSILNQASGRTCNDLTQYPVFPWVLSDYTSETLNLNSPESFRVLSKPMGALTPARREAAATRYSSLKSIGEEAFNYGTHFSSSMTVCHFLIRLAPFTHHFRRLQGGSWDLPDRLFHSVQRAWESASDDTRGDVRELIPEMFICHEFLDNRANLDMGIQGSGERVDNVKLPPWCNDDPYLFVQLHRQVRVPCYRFGAL